VCAVALRRFRFFPVDVDGDLQTSTTPLGEVETYFHNPQRDVIGITDRANRSTAFTYDSLGRHATITDPLGRVGVFSYALATATSWSGPTLYAQSPSATPAPVTLTAALADGQYQVGTNGIQPGGDQSHVALYRDATFQTSQWVSTDGLDRVFTRQDRAASGFSFDSPAPGAGNLGSTHPPFVDEQYNDGSNGSPWDLPFSEVTNDAYQANHVWSINLNRNPDFDLTEGDGPFLGLGESESVPRSAFAIARDAAGRVTGTTVGNAATPFATSSIGYFPNGQVSGIGLITPTTDDRYDGGVCSQNTDCNVTLQCQGTVIFPAQNPGYRCLVHHLGGQGSVSD